jgi:Tfp pilus assembly protein PilW
MRIRSGQSLLEVVVALGIIMIVLMGLVRAGATGIRNSSSSQSQTLSARYGTEATEWLKSELSLVGWAKFKSYQKSPGTYCLYDSPLSTKADLTEYQSYFKNITASTPCLTIPGTNLIREITIPTPAGIEKIDFQIVISWVEGNLNRSVTYTTELSSALSP